MNHHLNAALVRIEYISEYFFQLCCLGQKDFFWFSKRAEFVLNADVCLCVYLCVLQSPMPKTILIPIPISKSSAPRFRNSVEGLNQEIERIIIRDTPEKDETIVVSPTNRWKYCLNVLSVFSAAVSIGGIHSPSLAGH